MKAFIVELDNKGSYSRSAMSEQDFMEAYPNVDVDRLRGGDTDSLAPLIHVWAQEVEVGGKEWETFFTDMADGIPDADKDSGNFATVDILNSTDGEIQDAVKSAVKSVADKAFQDFVESHPEGTELYFDYRDKIDAETIVDAFEDYKEAVRSNPEETGSFEAYLEDIVIQKWNLYEQGDEETARSFWDSIPEDKKMLLEDYLDEMQISLGEALADAGYAGLKFDLSDVMDSYHMNLMIATPAELNKDFGSIPDMFEDTNFGNMSSDQQRREFDNALSYLVHQQGYEITEVADGYLNSKPSDNEFVQSVIDELNEFPQYSMAELTLLVTLDKNGLELLEQIAKGEGEITVSKETELGLFNQWQGTGSTLEIQLEKPFTFPTDMVYNLQLEGQKQEYHRGYTVNDVYGLVGSCWNGTVEKSEEPSRQKEIEDKLSDCVEAVIEVIEQANDKGKDIE